MRIVEFAKKRRGRTPAGKAQHSIGGASSSFTMSPSIDSPPGTPLLATRTDVGDAIIAAPAPPPYSHNYRH